MTSQPPAPPNPVIDSDSDDSAATAAPVRPPKKKAFTWSKTIINFWLDCALLVTFLVLAWVSAVLRFLFPVGPAEQEWSLWGLSVEEWRGFQFGTLCVLSLGIVLHVMLHWSWVCGVVTKHLLKRPPSRDDGSQTLIGVGVLLVILHVLGIGILWAWYSLEHHAA